MYLVLPILILFFGLTNYLILSGINVNYLSDVASLLQFLFLPGALISIIIKIRVKSIWEWLMLVVGSSLAFLMLYGVFINYAFLQFNSKPFTKNSILISFDILMVALFILAFQIRKKEILISNLLVKKKVKAKKLLGNLKPKISRNSLMEIFLFLFILSFPVYSVLGAISLNNGGGNFFTMLMLGSIAAVLILFTILFKKFNEGIYPTFIYFAGLSLLLMTSLRGWFLTGHDVQFEYFIFQLTKTSKYWDINLYRDAYNACLSITILPTILSSFTTFGDVYIYKVVYQMIFAFCPVALYFFLKKYTPDLFAFFSAFYFLTFPTFLNDMPMLNRQEIGFLFFSLILFIIFGERKIKGKRLFLTLFGFGMVTSHYSTNYVAIFILTLTYFGFKILRRLLKERVMTKFLKALKIYKNISKSNKKEFIPFVFLVFITALTITWNGLLTQTSGDLVLTIKDAFLNIGEIVSQENKSIDIAYSLFSSKKLSDQEYLKNTKEEYIRLANQEKVKDFYEPDLTQNLNPEIIENDKLPLTNLGKKLRDWGIDLFQFNYFTRQFLARLIQILILAGVLVILLQKSKYKYDLEYIIACLVSLFTILLFMILPQVSLNYGLLRLFQQLLLILALPVVLGFLSIFSRSEKDKVDKIVAIISIIFFLNLSGFTSEITGGYFPQLNLENNGIYYDAHYVKKSEVNSTKWLFKNMVDKATVQTDRTTRDKLLAYGPVYTLDSTFPQTLRRSAYIYMGSLNVKGRSVVSTDRSIIIKYPLLFLDANKDLIYNNGSSRVYR